MSGEASTKSADEIRNWMLSQVAAELGIERAEIDVQRPLTQYGLDSMTAVVLTGDLESWLGRPIAADLLGQFATIESLAQHLAAERPPPASSPVNPVALDEPEVEPGDWKAKPSTLGQRLVRKLTVKVVRLLTRIKVEGLENIPSSGPLIVASNHLHMIDAPALYSVLPGSPVFFASDHLLKFPLVGWYLRQLGQSIYVARGKGDRQAMEDALAVLRAGGTLTIAPEGRISRSGGLLPGQTGAAYLASRSGVPVLPLVLYGQEDFGRRLRRLRRTHINLRVGTPMVFPACRAGVRHLEEYTEEIMRALARLLPPRYRGCYAGGDIAGIPSGLSVTSPTEPAPAATPPALTKRVG